MGFQGNSGSVAAELKGRFMSSKIDWLTVIAIAAIAISVNVSFHEGVHALTCVAVGGELKEYSALYAECAAATPWQEKVVAGSAPAANIIAGTCLWLILLGARRLAPRAHLFLWLLMVMNWLYGAGYWIFSGVANVGDWAQVIEGWEPHWLFRAGMVVFGAIVYVLFVRLALRAFGRLAGGAEPLRMARRIGLVSYTAAVAVVLLAGLFSPHGPLGLPAVAGLAAAAGSLSPLAWAMRWFKADAGRGPLKISRSRVWIAAAAVVVFLYAFVLGRTLYF
ncbi:MAG: hypothetical protein JW747_09985 [Candidatus Aminicenantes bacterium]|nr:hypothetical protein [Candidatus Aminicenantes bacterium]